jgi:hypothetical protein
VLFQPITVMSDLEPTAFTSLPLELVHQIVAYVFQDGHFEPNSVKALLHVNQGLRNIFVL